MTLRCCVRLRLRVEQRARPVPDRRGPHLPANRMYLRHCGRLVGSTGRPSQHPGNLSELGARAPDHIPNLVTFSCRFRNCCLNRSSFCRCFRSSLLSKRLPRTRQSVALAVNQPLDLDRDLNIPFSIEALAGAALVRLKLRELRLPESQYIGLYLQKTRNIPDLEIETVRYRRNFNGALRGWMRCHSKMQRGTLLSRSIGHSLQQK